MVLLGLYISALNLCRSGSVELKTVLNQEESYCYYKHHLSHSEFCFRLVESVLAGLRAYSSTVWAGGLMTELSSSLQASLQTDFQAQIQYLVCDHCCEREIANWKQRAERFLRYTQDLEPAARQSRCLYHILAF